MTTTAFHGPAAEAGSILLGGEFPVNRIGFGAMRITGPGTWGPPADHDEAIRVLRRAIELGINFIDTANSYGPHVSEELIAEALYPYPEGLVIATKGGFERPGPHEWKMNGHPEHLRRELDGSLQRLRLDHIDLYQLHRVDPDVPEEDQFGTVAEFVKEGKVRLVGLSEVGVDQIKRAREFVPIASVQNKYNVVNRAWDDVVNYCDEQAIAFIPWSPLGAGKLAAATPALGEVAKRRGITPQGVALAWLLARSPMMLIIPGTSRVVHLEENVHDAAMGLSREDLELLDNLG